MKSDVNEHRHFIECNCGNPEHLLIFEFVEDDAYSEIAVYFTSKWTNNLWTRIRIAFRYIFKNFHFYWADAVIIDKENIKQLEDVIQKIKEN